MGLKITGSVKYGDEPVSTKVRLRITNQDTKKDVLDVEVETGVQGTFYHETVDATGKFFDYKGMKLRGEILDDDRFPPQEKVITGSEVDLPFWVGQPRSLLKDLVARMTDAALLKSQAYARIGAAADALPQALLVAVVASVAFGSALGAKKGVDVALIWSLIVFVSLAVQAAVMCLLGSTVLAAPTTNTTFIKFLRPVGFATTPLLVGAILMGLCVALGVSGEVLNLLFLAALVWELLALTVAVHEALGYRKQWGRALAVVLILPLVIVAVIWFTT